MKIEDLSNGYYPHLAKVASDSPAFLDVMAWLKERGAPATWVLLVPKMLVFKPGDSPNPAGDGPTEIHFAKPSGEVVKLDAALVFNFPHVALVELKQELGFGDPNVLERYPGFEARQPRPVPGPDSPIGAPWPERGLGAFRPSAFDSGDKYPYGATYTDATGKYLKERSGWGFVVFAVWRKQ